MYSMYHFWMSEKKSGCLVMIDLLNIVIFHGNVNNERVHHQKQTKYHQER